MIRRRAEELLAKGEVTNPPVPVEELARHLGIVVQRQQGDDELSGFILRDPRRNFAVIGVNETHHSNRQRFTIAHELGHFLLHAGESLHVDKNGSGYEVKHRDARSGEGKSVDEMEANLFAAELLMPATFLESDIADEGAFSLSDDVKIRRLANRYAVSAQALTLRLSYLGYVSG